jgi:hypothetical protein
MKFDCVIDFNQLTARPTRTIGFDDGVEGPSFELFTELPLEIRLAIWRFAFPSPRLISIHSDEDDDDMIHYGPWSKSNKSERRETPSDKQARRKFYGIFHTCKESRTEALKSY